ncbi:hypothetical protein MCC01950_14040 [Bifidobacteriaceae bacterium MCC01950]|nr:hypothetical protein MCC01950_14040 [Bifidobacteriaceae bacterium MCC01950]
MAQNPEATVVFGVLNETSETESRVALTPDIVTRLKRSGVSSIIEAGAGIAAEYTDEDYEKAGAKVTSRDEVLAQADALGFVDRPSTDIVSKLKAGQWVIGMLGSFTDARLRGRTRAGRSGWYRHREAAPQAFQRPVHG